MVLRLLSTWRVLLVVFLAGLLLFSTSLVEALVFLVVFGALLLLSSVIVLVGAIIVTLLLSTGSIVITQCRAVSGVTSPSENNSSSSVGRFTNTFGMGVWSSSSSFSMVGMTTRGYVL